MDAEAAARQAAAEAAHQQAVGIYNSRVAARLGTEQPIDDSEVFKLLNRDALEEVAEAVLMVEESYVTRDAGYKPRGLACFFFPKREGLADDEHQLQLQALSSLFTTVPDDSLYVCHYEILGFLTAHLTQLRGGEWRGVIGAAAGRLRVLKRELQGRGPPIRALLQLQLFLDSLITAQWGERCKEKVEQARQAGKGSEESAEAVSMLLNSLNQRAWDVTRSFRNSTAGHDAATAIVTVVSEGQLGEGLYAALQELSRSDDAEHVMAGLVTYMDQFKEGSFGKLALAVSCMIEVLLGDARRPECCGPAFYFGVLTYGRAHDAFTVLLLHQYATVELQNALDVLTMGSMLWDLRTAKPVLGVVNRICETVALLDPNFASKMRRGAIVQAMVAERMQGMRALLHSLGLRMDKLEQTVAAILHSLGLRMDELEQTVAAILRQVAAVREDVAAVRGDVAAVAAATAGELAVVREAAIGVARGVAAVADRQAATDARVTEQASMLIEHDIKIKQLGDLLLLAVERTLTREQVLNALKGPGAAFGSPVAVEKTEGVEAEDSAAGSSRTAEVVPLGVAAEASDASSSRAAAAPAAAEPEAAAAVPAAAEPEVAAPGSHAVAAASVAAAPAAAAQAAERSGSSAAAAGASNRAVERGRAGFGFGRNTAERQQKREEAERQKEEREKEAIRLVQETGSASGTVTHNLGGTLQRKSYAYAFGYVLQVQAEQRQALALRRQQYEAEQKEAARRQAEAERRQEEAAARRQAEAARRQEEMARRQEGAAQRQAKAAAWRLAAEKQPAHRP